MTRSQGIEGADRECRKPRIKVRSHVCNCRSTLICRMPGCQLVPRRLGRENASKVTNQRNSNARQLCAQLVSIRIFSETIWGAYQGSRQAVTRLVLRRLTTNIVSAGA